MIKPKALIPGSRVAVISPAGPVLPAHLAEGLAQLEAWGLAPITPDAVWARRPSPRGYLAGDDAARLAALHAALDDDSIDAIIFSRGGYGSMRLLDQLDWARLEAHPKLIMGFSDVTALLIAQWQQLGLVGLHGPVVKSFTLYQDDPHQTREQTRRALFGLRGAGWQLAGLEPVRPGVARGALIGGNLSLISALMGTPWQADCAGKIVFLEEVGEQDYRLDRLLTQLRLSWLKAPPAGIMFGDFTGCAGVYAPEDQLGALLVELALELNIPAVMNLPVGHAGRNVPLPIGVEATLDAERGVLTVHGDCADG